MRLRQKPKRQTQLEQLVRRALVKTPVFVAPLFGAEEFARNLLAEIAAEARSGKVRLPRFGTFRMHTYAKTNLTLKPFAVLKFSAAKNHRAQR